MSVTMIIDLAFIVALCGATLAATFLSVKISKLSKNKEDIRHFMETVAESLIQAKGAINSLESMSARSTQDLQEKIRLAKALRRDLELSARTAEKVLKTAERYLPQSAQIPSMPSAPSTSIPPTTSQRLRQPSHSPNQKSLPTSRVEPRLVQALQNLS